MRQIVCSNCMSRVDIGARECPYCGQSFANTNPAGALPVNTLLAGRYTLAKCLRVDGEGVEYDAIDGQTERRVVVKEYIPFTICAARMADGRVMPRPGREVLYKTTRMDFVDLYRALADLGNTEGLVTVLDLVEANNTAYAVREPDEGMSLLEYLDELRIPLTSDEALNLLSPVVNGVEAMHRMGLLHRGISPETVRITDKGAKLSGYATLGLRTADSDLKPHLADGYAAPEQYSVAEFQGAYTDIYSLGALFYFAVTGRTPLPANLRRVQDTLPGAHSILKQVPGYFSAAIASAMRVTPAERIQSADDLLAALVTPGRGASLATSFGGLSPRHWKIIGACALGFVLVMALSIWAIVNSLPQEGPASSSSTASVSDSAQAGTSGTSSGTGGNAQSSSKTPVVEKILVPTFKGQKYEDVSRNQEYINQFRFTAEHEYSSEYAKGVIIRQDPLAGAEVDVGTVVKLVVSQGPKTALMPVVKEMNVNTAIEELTKLGIKYQIKTMENDGSYVKDMVVDCDFAPGTEVNLDTDTVQLYVAGEPSEVPNSGVPPVIDVEVVP